MPDRFSYHRRHGLRRLVRTQLNDDEACCESREFRQHLGGRLTVDHASERRRQASTSMKIEPFGIVMKSCIRRTEQTMPAFITRGSGNRQDRNRSCLGCNRGNSILRARRRRAPRLALLFSIFGTARQGRETKSPGCPNRRHAITQKNPRAPFPSTIVIRIGNRPRQN